MALEMTPAEYRAAREALGLSQEKLARELGVSANTVARWEQGSRRITERAAKEITRLLETKKSEG